MKFFVAFACFLAGLTVAMAQPPAANGPRRAVKVSIKTNELKPFGTLYATIRGEEVRVAEGTLKAWILRDGKLIVYSAPGTSLGFEAEGQALLAYDVTTGETTDLHVSEFVLQKVTETRSRKGKYVLLVAMSDSGLIAPHFMAIEPKTKQLNIWERSRLVNIKNGKIVLGMYPTGDHVKMGPGDSPPFIRTFDLDTVFQ